MLGPAHFKKKLAKKARKKEAKEAKEAKKKPQQQSKQKQKKHGTISGPIVPTVGARDTGNDRKNIPFHNKFQERSYKKERRIPSYNAVVDPDKGNAAKQAGASSAAQRRRVLRSKGDDDLLDHFRTKLNSSTFRLLNEQIYNSPNDFAARLLRDAQTFQDYHVGYQQQLVQWPVNPNQLIIDALLGDRRGKFSANKSKSMPGHIPPSWVVVDMGCGEAQVARALRPRGYTVHSFDFCALNEYVTVADAAHVPLEPASADVVVFSLSLMATDYELCLFEAFRILKPKRLLKIIEVRSRVPVPRRFSQMVESIGFSCEYQDVAGDYFVAFDFIKNEGQEEPNRNLAFPPGEVLVPSLYKKR